MGLGGMFKKFNKAMLGPTGGLGTLFGLGDAEENIMARIPIVNSLTGAQTDSQKELLRKQEQLAADAKKREQSNAQARMQALGQSLMAFNPQNQLMAQMFGPEAAFTPQQFSQMAADPRVAGQAWGTGSDQDRTNQVLDKQRREQILKQMQAVPQGPAPLDPRKRQAARRF